MEGKVNRNAFFPLEDYPKLKKLADAWQEIRQDLLSLNAPELDIDRSEKSHAQVIAEINSHMENGGRLGWLYGWGMNGKNPDWLQYPVMVNDVKFPHLAGTMQNTVELLRDVNGIRICALSKMKPHSFLSTHRHPELAELGILQLHITLDAPAEHSYCYLNVDGEFRQHVNGAAFIFDGSLDHFAVNASGADRTVLYIEFDRRLLCAG